MAGLRVMGDAQAWLTLQLVLAPGDGGCCGRAVDGDREWCTLAAGHPFRCETAWGTWAFKDRVPPVLEMRTLRSLITEHLGGRGDCDCVNEIRPDCPVLGAAARLVLVTAARDE